MTVSVGPIEAIWIIVNLVTFAFTLSAFVDARADRAAVRMLNGHARELIADGTVRREGIRLAVQVLLLAVAVPGVFSDREIVLSIPIVALMTVPALLLASSFFDARDRKALTVLVAADIVSDASKRFDRLEQALAENTTISVKAFDAANHVAERFDAVNERITAGEDLATERHEATAETIDTTAGQVADLHSGAAPTSTEDTAPEKAT